MIPLAIAGILFLALYENPNPEIEEKDIYCSLALLVTHEVIDHPRFGKVPPQGFGKFDKKLKQHIKNRIQELELLKSDINHNDLTDKVFLLTQKIHSFFRSFLEEGKEGCLDCSCIYTKKRQKMFALCSKQHKNKNNIFCLEHGEVLDNYENFEKEWKENKELAKEIFLCGIITFFQRKLVWLIHIIDQSAFDQDKLSRSKIKWESALEKYANLSILMEDDRATLLDNYLSNCTRILLFSKANHILKKEESEWKDGKLLGVGTLVGLGLCGATEQVYKKGKKGEQKMGKSKKKKNPKKKSA